MTMDIILRCDSRVFNLTVFLALIALVFGILLAMALADKLIDKKLLFEDMRALNEESDCDESVSLGSDEFESFADLALRYGEMTSFKRLRDTTAAKTEYINTELISKHLK